YGSYADSNVLF
nr:immunoglobulin light chain junction region [Macaca mulatta]